MTFRRLAPVLLLTLFGLFIFAPFLFFGYVTAGNEQIGFYYALTHFTEIALHTGTSLVWNGGNYGGESATFNQFASAWNPLNRLLFLFFSFFTVEHISITLSTIGGLVFAYWFGRKQGWHIASSLTLALAYLSAITYGWLQVGTLPSGAFLVCPTVLVALLLAAESKNAKEYLLAVALGGGAFGFGFLAGFMQFVLYNACVAGLYALFLDWEKWKHGVSYIKHVSTSISYAGMILLGLCIGIKQWLPSTLLLNQSVRTNTFAMQNAEVPHITHFITYLLPPYFEVPYLSGGSGEGLYIGALGLACALIGLIYYRTRTTIFFGGVYVLAAALACHVPVLSWLNEHIPPFSHMSGNLRWFAAGAFPLAYIGASGVEGLVRQPDVISRHASTIILRVVAGVGLALVVGSLLLRVIAHYVAASPAFLTRLLTWYAHGRTLTYGSEYYVSLLAGACQKVSAMFSLDNPRFLFGVICWALAWVALYILYRPALRRFGPYTVIAAMTITVAGTCMLQWSQLVPKTLYERKPQLIEYLQAKESDPHSYRILGALVGDGLYRQYFSSYEVTPVEASIMHREMLASDANLLYGVDSMGGLRPFQTLRMNQLLGTVVGYETENYIFDPQSPALSASTLTHLYNTDVEKKVDLEEKKRDLLKRLPLLSMMNVKYIYSPESFIDLRLKLVDTLHLPVASGIPIYVYENATVLPRVYVSRGQQFVSGMSKEALKKVAEVTDFSKETVIECSDCIAATEGKVEIVVGTYINGSIQFTTTSKHDAWIVVSESASPGWQAAIDGAPTKILIANYLFQAIRVPPGDHKIVFSYRDPSIVNLFAQAYQNK